jgi:hypothetical protein
MAFEVVNPPLRFQEPGPEQRTVAVAHDLTHFLRASGPFPCSQVASILTADGGALDPASSLYG